MLFVILKSSHFARPRHKLVTCVAVLKQIADKDIIFFRKMLFFAITTSPFARSSRKLVICVAGAMVAARIV
jgi:hypothetical protein